ncbi:hypothetical protein [uncultured Zhongshania sp.]|jgi:hypothetical protein|uniref:hypothetical protein n=1 Tax=uncultured Zhongshania sp. TaxID=1642288 RepID=UPI0025F5AD2A|nr:hypothetical protein [uncultured Zhongshania sp.]
MHKALIVILLIWFGVIPVGWYFEYHLGFSSNLVSNTSTVIQILGFLAILLVPWMKLPGQERLSNYERLSQTVILWIFIALSPRLLWELPWLFFLDEIREGVENGALWSYIWAGYLRGGDLRYLTGDTLVVVLEWIALFVGVFEGWALWRFFVQGKRFTNIQLSLIMAGMIVEVTLPAVYFGVEIANNLENVVSPADLWIKFILLNSFWCTMPLVTFFWGARRLATQDLSVKF